MFFITCLRRELRRRLGRAVSIGLGLAPTVGPVVAFRLPSMPSRFLELPRSTAHRVPDSGTTR
jgi:hypothetical protein